MELEVKGHSGCQIDVIREGNELFVYKSTHDLNYLNRLQFQAKKQQEAENLELQHIRIPKVFEVYRDSYSVTIKMEYVYSKNFIGYFEYAGFEQISYFIKALCLFLNYEIKNSPILTVNGDLVKRKFDDVYKRRLVVFLGLNALKGTI